MSGSDTLAFKAKQFVASLPGRRESSGGTIPDDIWHRLTAAAHGISQQVWGRYATPEQIQHLYDNGLHEPQDIHEAFGKLPHPHAPGLTVAEYGPWAKAHETFQRFK